MPAHYLQASVLVGKLYRSATASLYPLYPWYKLPIYHTTHSKNHHQYAHEFGSFPADLCHTQAIALCTCKQSTSFLAFKSDLPQHVLFSHHCSEVVTCEGPLTQPYCINHRFKHDPHYGMHCRFHAAWIITPSSDCLIHTACIITP
eukprot:1157114-Pelagomonas_calceolata.AAC.7